MPAIRKERANPPAWVDSNFLRLMDAAPDAMLVTCQDGDVVLANAQAEKLFGYMREELIGNSIEILVPLASREIHARHRENFARHAKTRPMGAGLRLSALRKDGSEIPVEISLSPLRTVTGAFVISAIRDATEQRRAEKTFRDLLESAPDAMIIVNLRGQITRVNTQTEKVFGATRDELLGKPIETLIPDRFRHRHQDHQQSFLSNPRVRPMGRNLALYALRRDGCEFPVEISLSPLTTEEGLQVIAAIRDISDRKRTEEKVVQLNQELQEKVADLAAKNKELEAFSYSVSHDLRAPLRQIDGFSKILLRESSDVLSMEHREHLQEIRNGAHHLGQLVDDLLNFSRLGRQALVLQTVSLNALLGRVIAEKKTELEGTGRLVEWGVGNLPNAVCDETLMRQVFRNLISNAVKFTKNRPATVISIGHRVLNGEIAFYVRDNGAGFDMRYADKLFGVFQRLHLQEEFEGTGVGLATVQRVILKHGGRVWAEAEPDKGATFFFTLSSVISAAPRVAHESKD